MSKLTLICVGVCLMAVGALGFTATTAVIAFNEVFPQVEVMK